MSFDQFRKLTTITSAVTRYVPYKVKEYTYHGPGGPVGFGGKNLHEAYNLFKKWQENQKKKS